MNLRKRLDELGGHFKVPQGSMSMRDWSFAIKKAARAENDSIEVIYDRAFGKKPIMIEAKAVEVKTEPSKPEAVKGTEVKVEGAAQRVEVQATVLHFNIPAPNVHVGGSPPADTWIYTLERVGSHAFTLVAGVMLGLLLAKRVLPLVGLS